ncbi:site-specific DNA-methyltransferase (adenine-specific) [Terribacillus aidingensis]|uniref:Site-specific DNA-methyltransferase (Adenine-specific) n=1 Tax=Terribacillus aidingensis TaxID=586416 RepID=A0A285PD50_9BACI|nr:class I SAM-dependent methyltransferase [Terribacillus aidingensis]SNZ18066.1 site-specific DNA-methyltransferase (adenine-specific) [Terribacillus aidingensis]
MEQQNVEKVYQALDQMAESLESHENIAYLDALGAAMEYIIDRETELTEKPIVKQQLDKHAAIFDKQGYKKEEVRKGIQLAILKGMKGATQQQHMLTPDTVAMLIGYLTNKLVGKNDNFRLFDPAVGTGNLLTAVLNQVEKDVQAYGSDVDPTLIQLAVMSANMQERQIEFFHQDSLRPFLLEPVDLVVSDLPVGYYPDDVQAAQYDLKAEEGHSYSHHLFIEQSLHYTKEGGYLLFVVPNFLFESDQARSLHAFLQQQAHIVGLLQFPDSMFKSESQAKSVLILQKKGTLTTAPKQALLVQLPSFKNPNAMSNVLKQINDWFDNELTGLKN